MPTVNSSDNVEIHYTKAGSRGSNVVLIHGWCCRAAYWQSTVKGLEKDHRVYAVDLAGHGESGKNRKEWTIENYGHDIEALVNHEKLDEVILVGHSMGGDVALEAATLLGERVKGVVLVDSYHNIVSRTEEYVQERVAPLKKEFKSNAKRWDLGMFSEHADPEIKEKVAEEMACMDPEMAIPSIEAAFRYNNGAAFDKLNVPVRTINREGREADYEAAKKRVQDFEWIEIKDCGHFIMLERLDEFNKVLKDIIASLG